MTIDQVVFLKPINNAARRAGGEIKKSVITKMGRKYYEVKGYGRFEIKSNFQDNGQYPSNYIAYATQQQIEDEIEAERLSFDIGKAFNTFNRNKYTLSQLRRITNIINEKLNP